MNKQMSHKMITINYECNCGHIVTSSCEKRHRMMLKLHCKVCKSSSNKIDDIEYKDFTTGNGSGLMDYIKAKKKLKHVKVEKK